jgi:vancomycin permeability regulator SanA
VVEHWAEAAKIADVEKAGFSKLGDVVRESEVFVENDAQISDWI